VKLFIWGSFVAHSSYRSHLDKPLGASDIISFAALVGGIPLAGGWLRELCVGLVE
jgi:hypothetical protein